jgi:hypothetical protein
MLQARHAREEKRLRHSLLLDKALVVTITSDLLPFHPSIHPSDRLHGMAWVHLNMFVR